MRWQTTLVAAILLALVGGFYYVYEVRLGPDREKAEARKGRVFARGDHGRHRRGAEAARTAS